MATLPTPGVTPGPDWALSVNDALLEGMLSRCFIVGQLGNVFPHNPAGAGGYLYTQGYEHAVGLLLPQMTIDAFQVVVNTVAAVGGVFRVGMRKISNNHQFSPPLFDESVPVTTTGDKLIILPAPVVLDGGLYAVTWTIYGEGVGTLKPWCGPYIIPFPAVSLSMGSMATGNQGMAMRLNQSISGPLPTTCTGITGVGGNFQPIVFSLRRSA